MLFKLHPKDSHHKPLMISQNLTDMALMVMIRVTAVGRRTLDLM